MTQNHLIILASINYLVDLMY